MRSPVQFGKLKRAELNMDMERDGRFCTGECDNNAPCYCLWNNSYIPYWADAPPGKNQAIILKHSVRCTVLMQLNTPTTGKS